MALRVAGREIGRIAAGADPDLRRARGAACVPCSRARSRTRTRSRSTGPSSRAFGCEHTQCAKLKYCCVDVGSCAGSTGSWLLFSWMKSRLKHDRRSVGHRAGIGMRRRRPRTKTRSRLETSSRIGACVIAKRGREQAQTPRPPSISRADRRFNFAELLPIWHARDVAHVTGSSGERARRDRIGELAGAALGGGIVTPAPLGGVVQLGQLSHVRGERRREPRGELAAA